MAWRKLPIELRDRAVTHLLYRFDPTFFSTVKERARHYGLDNWLPGGWHFTQGMDVRNTLRDVIQDAELPSFDEYYGPGSDVRNWDDYYIQCVEAAAGLRDVHV